MHQDTNADLITEIQLATRWRVTQRTIRRWRHEFKCPDHIRIGRRVFYRLSDVHEFERDSTERGY